MRTTESLVPLDEARQLLDNLVASECRGFGDTHNAIRRLERYGLRFWTLRNLRQGKLRGDCTRLLASLERAWLLFHADRAAVDLARVSAALDERQTFGGDLSDLQDLVAEFEELLGQINQKLNAGGSEICHSAAGRGTAASAGLAPQRDTTSAAVPLPGGAR